MAFNDLVRAVFSGTADESDLHPAELEALKITFEGLRDGERELLTMKYLGERVRTDEEVRELLLKRGEEFSVEAVTAGIHSYCYGLRRKFEK